MSRGDAFTPGPTRSGVRVARWTALAIVLATASATAAKRAPLCPGARYLVSPGTSLASGSAIVIDEAGEIAIAGHCEPTRPRRQRARGTKLRVRWSRCPGLGRVRLVGTLDPDCARLTGTLQLGPTPRVPFAASLSVCGDGLRDAGEECDGVDGCATACAADCRCLPVTSTTATTTSITTSTTSTTIPFLPGLPPDVTGYQSWLRLNAALIGVHPGGDAHFGTKNVYANQPRETLAPGGVQRLPYPDGTILVKESTRPGRDFIGLVSIMRKRAGSDPLHGDWQFIEYGRSSARDPFVVVGQDVICWTCHAFVASRDWVYTLLDPAP
jgi:hypothetical protein